MFVPQNKIAALKKRKINLWDKFCIKANLETNFYFDTCALIYSMQTNTFEAI